MIFKRTEKNVVEIYGKDQFWTIVPAYLKEIEDTYVVIHEKRNSGSVRSFVTDGANLKDMFDYDVIDLLNDVVPQ